ncbi:MAG: FAD:protein FMN transferase [Gemmataceae bacterium]|nr:FAD:protein FMN transferase [Gemmataceae bacterium]
MRGVGWHAWFVVAAVMPTLAPQLAPDLRRFTFQEPHMGTLFRIVLYAPDEGTAKAAAKEAFARVAELNRIMSDYLADSELMQLCQRAGGDPVPVSADLFAVLHKADEIARLSDGAFDVSIGPVVRLWRTARKTKKLPDPEQLKQALAKVDFRKIRLDAQRRTVQLLLVGMLLDLGGIAKGYAADAILAVLRRHGITRALAGAGGDVVVGDPPPDAKAWKIGIMPLTGTPDEPIRYLALSNAAVSTAGDLNQFVQIDGRRYSHIVDPRTGMGLLGRHSVTVIAPTGLEADGLDTAACVLGVEKGKRLIEGLPGCAALFVIETNGKVSITPTRHFERYLWKE